MHVPNKKTKIVATIGPASDGSDVLSALITAGLNVARLNMSHGSHEEHGSRIQTIRDAAAALGTPISILLDLAGPKIRTGTYATERITIAAGDELTLTTEEIVGDASRFSVNYAKLPEEVSPGTIIMLDDGAKKLEVVEVKDHEIRCRVLVGGELKSRRGVNVPGAHLSIETITEKDKADLAFGLAGGIDMVALSFVRRAEDVRELRELCRGNGRVVPIIVKIETQEALEGFDAILVEADGVMIARGDLAVEIPAEMVPLHQKDIIRKCTMAGKPVITATQMLESMVRSPVPTRAEVSDIANAIVDGTDAIMLSEESALGAYPVEAVTMMAKIAEAVEHDIETKSARTLVSIQDSVTHSICTTAKDVQATLIVALTESGTTAELIARFRPPIPVIALSPHEATVRKLHLVRGVYPYQTEGQKTLAEALAAIPEFVTKHNVAKKGDVMVVSAGLSSFGVPGSTNMLAVLQV
ncbi:pyruvate kinase [Candidatus Parcubacteria bacterium]|nr:pyruvate kinase [Candidatus Parcubacteria bacterium]